MSPSVKPFNEAKYKALMDGLECSEIRFNEIHNWNPIFIRVKLKPFSVQQGLRVHPLTRYLVTVVIQIHCSLRLSRKLRLIQNKAQPTDSFVPKAVPFRYIMYKLL